MGEVAAVAAITGGASALTSAITAMVTWRVSKNSSSVELAKVVAEKEHLQMGNREDERRNRQSTYHQFIDVLIAVFQTLGTEIPVEKRGEILDQYNHLLAGVVLFGPPSVRRGAYAVNDVYSRIWPDLAEEQERHPKKSPPECWKDATSGLQGDFGRATSELVGLMHADVTRGIADDPIN